MGQMRARAPLILTAAFILFLLALNSRLFLKPIVEVEDRAANSLLVQQAKHFTLLTGHYSRWRFHHPGPAFLYLFALGEFLFHDVLHVVPAPYNGQLLITIIFNGMLLCAALYVFQRHAKLSIPLMLLATTVIAVLVNVGSYQSMLVSNWPPDVLLFPYLLFTVSAASVMTDETRDLPFMAVSGMLLIHAHVAQFLFVGAIGGVTVGYVLMRARRQGRLRDFLSERRRDFTVAASIVLVFALPPLLELVLDRPNNLDALIAYRQVTANMRNSAGTAIGYFACFLFFVGSPEVVLSKGPAGIIAVGLPRPYVCTYWAVLAVLFAFVLTARPKPARHPRAPFLRYLTWIGAGSVALFLYWGTRITGKLFSFNGTFIYSLHLLVWLLLLAELEPRLDCRLVRVLNVLALACLLVLGIAERSALRSRYRGASNVLEAAMLLPASPFGTLAITFDHGDWPWAVGVANAMKRVGKPFCVSRDWGFMFSNENVCPDILIADKLWLATAALPCTPRCRYVYRDADFSIARYPPQLYALPVEVSLHDSPGTDLIGFNDDEGMHRWTQSHTSIRFWLSPKLPTAPCFRIALTGSAFPGRPTQLGVNGHALGTLSKSVLDTALFLVPRQMIRPGEVNSISLDTEKAGPAGADKRALGFSFVNLVLRVATPDESCVVDPATQPESFDQFRLFASFTAWAKTAEPIAFVQPRQSGRNPQFFLRAQTPDSECRAFHRSRKGGAAQDPLAIIR
jgi:hypothetical protein